MRRLALISHRLPVNVVKEVHGRLRSRCDLVFITDRHLGRAVALGAPPGLAPFDLVLLDGALLQAHEGEDPVHLPGKPQPGTMIFNTLRDLVHTEPPPEHLFLARLDGHELVALLSNALALLNAHVPLVPNAPQRLLEAASTIGRSVATDTGLENLCDLTMRHVTALFSPDHLFLLFLADDNQDFYVKRFSVHGQPLTPPTLTMPRGLQPLWQLTRERSTLRLSPRDELRANLPRDLFGRVQGELLLTPMIAENRVKGILCLERKKPLSLEEQSQVETLAAQLAVTIDYAWLYNKMKNFNILLEEEVTRRSEELSLANLELGRALRELQDTELQLVQQEKMATLGQLAAGLAHEINNPLSFVLNNVELCRRNLQALRCKNLVARLRDSETPGSEADLDALEDLAGELGSSAGLADDLRELRADLEPLPLAQRSGLFRRFLDYLEASLGERTLDGLVEKLTFLLGDIRQGLERTKNIVLDLRTFSRLDEAEFQEADLDQGLRATLGIVAHQAKERGVTLREDLGLDRPVLCSPSKLNQVMLNLLVNAIQACSAGGLVVVRSRLVDDRVKITVTDDGEGIPQERLPRIFDPYFTTKPIGEGTGLGLAICYRIVGEHHGALTVESTEGKGSTFTVDLPLRPPSTRKDHGNSVPSAPAPLQGKGDRTYPTALQGRA